MCSQNDVPAGPGTRRRPPSARDLADAYLANSVVDIHTMSRGSYGAPRMHAELRMELDMRVGRKRIARLLRLTGRAGIGGNTHKKRRTKPAPAPHEDLVQRRFVADEPNRLWCTDIERHEALLNRAVVKGHRLRSVVAGRVKLRAA